MGIPVSTDDFTAIRPYEIVSRMVGRKIEGRFPAEAKRSHEGETAEVRNIVRAGILHDISFRPLSRGDPRLCRVSWVQGRSELGRAIFGADPIDSGDVIMGDRKLSLNSPADTIKAGINATSRRNRKAQGLAVKCDSQRTSRWQTSRRFQSVLA